MNGSKAAGRRDDIRLFRVAPSLPRAERDAVIARYERSGIDHRIRTFDWIRWRGIPTRDPGAGRWNRWQRNTGWGDASGSLSATRR